MSPTKINVVRPLREILDDDSQPPLPIVDNGILLKNSMLLISGKAKAGKSFLSYNFAVAMSAGENFAGFTIREPVNVLVLSAEGGYYPNRDRIKRMCAAKEVRIGGNLNICFDTRLFLDDKSDLQRLRQMVDQHKPEVLVIDPLIRFHLSEENSSSGMIRVLGGIRRISEDHNLAVVLVHHHGKVEYLGARGSSAIMGEYDSAIRLCRHASGHEVEFDMRHVKTPDPKRLQFNPETLWFEEIEEDGSPVIRILRKRGPMTKNELVNALLENGSYESTSGAYKVIDRDADGGKIMFDGDKYSG